MTVSTIERIGSPEIAPHVAYKAFQEYRRAVLHETDRQRQREYQALMRGYRAIAKGQQVIDLAKVMKAAGLQEDTHYPKLAICRADAAKCFLSMSNDGSAWFSSQRSMRARSKAVRLGIDTFPRYTWQQHGHGWKSEASALVPMIPPALKPKRNLGGFHILWDAVWTPEPPVDPLLLKHCGGTLYAIVAAWDLTPLEQAVMRGRIGG